MIINQRTNAKQTPPKAISRNSRMKKPNRGLPTTQHSAHTTERQQTDKAPFSPENEHLCIYKQQQADRDLTSTKHKDPIQKSRTPC
jgi:hypothetical protein